MRFVIYDEETLQPITVVNVPGLSEAEIERMGRRLRLAPPIDVPFLGPNDGAPVRSMLPVLELSFERLARRNRAGEVVEGLMCFTSAVDLALMLKPDWLLGQEPAIRQLERQNEALTGMLIRAITDRR